MKSWLGFSSANLAFLLCLWTAPAALACAKCHAAGGSGCADGCTCCGHGSPPTPAASLPPPEPGVVDIAMVDYIFSPDDLTITTGTTVRWTNLDAEPHDTVSNDFLWKSEYLNPGESYIYTFDAESANIGTFTYVCTLHGGMSGSITVLAPEPSGLLLLLAIGSIIRRRLP
jgi:plastocyanin